MKIGGQLRYKGKVRIEYHLIQVELKKRRVHSKSSQLSCPTCRDNSKKEGSLQGEQLFRCGSQRFKQRPHEAIEDELKGPLWSRMLVSRAHVL